MKSPPRTMSGNRKAPDGGWGWAVVFGSFMISVLGDGFSYTSGIFYENFLTVYNESESITSLFNSIMTGMIYCIGPFASGLTYAYGCRKIAIVGSLLTVIGMLGSILLDSIYFHCITLGFITGTGLGLLYLPQIIIVTYWFDKRLSFAMGIAVCGSGIGIAIFAVMSDTLIATYSWKGAMLLLSGLMFTNVAFSTLFRKVDYIEEKSDLKTALKESINVKILTDFVFLYFSFANFLNGLVYYAPIIFLKDHTIRSGIGNDRDAIRLYVFFGLANALGRAIFGYIADKEFVNRIVLYACSVIAYGVIIGLVGITTSYSFMVICIVIYGAAEGAYVCLCSVVLVDLFGLEKVSNAFGILSFIEGIASIIGPPILGKTVDSKGYKTAFFISSVLTVISGILLLFLPIIHRKYKISNK